MTVSFQAFKRLAGAPCLGLALLITGCGGNDVAGKARVIPKDTGKVSVERGTFPKFFFNLEGVSKNDTRVRSTALPEMAIEDNNTKTNTNYKYYVIYHCPITLPIEKDSIEFINTKNNQIINNIPIDFTKKKAYTSEVIEESDLQP